MWPALLTLIPNILDKIFPDPAAASQAKLDFMKLVQDGKIAEMTEAAGVVKAEAASPFALTSQWRPILMLTFTAIVANNYILAPYLQALLGWHVSLELPPRMWDLLNIGVGGYIVGRSAEKAADSYSNRKFNVTLPKASSPSNIFPTNGA